MWSTGHPTELIMVTNCSSSIPEAGYTQLAKVGTRLGLERPEFYPESVQCIHTAKSRLSKLFRNLEYLHSVINCENHLIVV